MAPLGASGSGFDIVDRRDAVGSLRAELEACSRMALDLEAAGYHRYSDAICLAQVTVSGRHYVLDPFGFDAGELLRSPLEDPGIEVVMHGASHDLRLMARDWRISVKGLFDTQAASELLGLDSTGLGSLVESRLGVALSKAYQRADWAVRPLPRAMLEYAANDTRYLFELADGLDLELRSLGRDGWLREECRVLESAPLRSASEGFEPASRIKGAGRLAPKELEALRMAIDWRDRIARTRDAAPFRVVHDKALFAAAAARPRSVFDLQRVNGFPPGLAISEGRRLVERIKTLSATSDGEIDPLRALRRPSSRVPRDLEAKANEIRDLRNRRAAELKLARGALLSNATIAAVVRRGPATNAELAEVRGMRKWQTELLGEEILELLDGDAQDG